MAAAPASLLLSLLILPLPLFLLIVSTSISHHQNVLFPLLASILPVEKLSSSKLP
jgi:hypothetical protein